MSIYAMNHSQDYRSTIQNNGIYILDQTGALWNATISSDTINIKDGDGNTATLTFSRTPPKLDHFTPQRSPIHAFSVGVAYIFSLYSDLEYLIISEGIVSCLSKRDIAGLTYDGKSWIIWRDGFYQAAPLWIGHSSATHIRAGYSAGPDGRNHPMRPIAPEGELYRRYDPLFDVTVSLRAFDINRDIERFHKWMNDGRVSYFWELAEPEAALVKYLEGRQADPHTDPVIVSFNGEAAGYFETYWVHEDRLGPYYQSSPWDRGWHALIGEKQHLGRRKTAAWIRALTHYLFLDCPLTENIMGEPRADNVKLLRYADSMSYEKLKEFDFPHKRSALMQCRRMRFFKEQML